MTSELKDIILTIDTREQNQVRIKAVKDWAVSHGAIVEHSKLDLCDYRLIGEFRGVPVNIGIEAKSLSDFATSYSELSDKLARSYQLYDDVALFVEAANYTFTPDTDNFHAIIDNPAVRNGNADVLPLAVYENMLASFQKEGVHVRQLRSEAHFPYAIAGLLITITKPIHTGLHIKSKDFTSQYLNVLAKVPHISMARATKLINNYPNLNWLCGASEESYKQVLENKIGSELYAFIRCHDLETDEWRNNYHMDGTEKDEPIDDECRCTDGLHFYKISPTPGHFKHSSHAEGNLLNIHNLHTPSADTISSHPPLGYKKVKPKLKGDDTSSHPSSFIESFTTRQKLDDPRSPPISEVKQEGFSHNSLPAEINIGLDDIPLKCVVKCRACHQAIADFNDDETGYCRSPECIAERQKPLHAKNLIDNLKIYLKQPHTVPEIVLEFGVTSGYAFDTCMDGVKAGKVKKVTDFNTKVTTFHRID